MSKSLEHARILFEKARGDAHILTRITGDLESPDWGVGFHAQQAVEKAIKVVLTSRGIAYPFTHDLQLLLSVLEDEGIDLPPDSKSLPNLTPYGALFRYDTVVSGESKVSLDRQNTLQIVNRTLTWAESFL